MDQARIYTDDPDGYDALVAAEDVDGNLLPAIAELASLDGASVLEVGVGTGRVTRLLLPRVDRLVGVERATPMLRVARRHVAAMGAGSRCLLVQGDARALPVGDGWADVAIAGWVFGHFPYWMRDRWQDEIARGLAELARALRSGGTIVVIETLGTMATEPGPPSTELDAYYAWLEGEQGFRRVAIRTDYLFPDLDTAATRIGFFFGDALADKVRRTGSARVPEWTGLWWRQG